MKLLRISLTLILITAILALPRLFVIAADAASPEAAYNSYLKAIQSNDLESVKKLIRSSRLTEWEKDADKKLAALRQSRPAEVEHIGQSTSGRKAVLLVKNGNISGTITMYCEKNEWKVDFESWEGQAAPPSPVRPSPSSPEIQPASRNKPPDKDKPAQPVKQSAEKPVQDYSKHAAVLAYENYRKAIMDGNVTELKKYVQPDKWKELEDSPKEKLAMIKGFMPASVTITDVEDEDSTTAIIYAKGTTFVGASFATITMKLEGGQWQVVEESWKAGDVKEPKRRDPALQGVPGKIAFIDNRTGEYEIHVINADGTKPKAVSKTGGFKESFAWSPDGRQIAFDGSKMGSDEKIHVVNADGSNQVMVTDKEGRNSDPIWSADGSKIAFKNTPTKRDTSPDGSVTVNFGKTEICVVNANGTGLRQITENAEASNSELSWSPDGTEIAYSALKENKWNIFTVEVATGQTRKLTSGNWDALPAWSPDGKTLAFIGQSDFGEPLSLCLVNRDGSGQKTVYQDKVQRKQICWAPYGDRMLFIVSKDGHFSDDVCAINPDGTDLVRITKTKEQEDFPSWSPDGQWVCFKRDQEFYIARSDGSGQEYKISDESGGHKPCWSPR
ncbi:MAG: hypothetical protein WC980_10540 [Candidatus Brocadiia bacterium]